MKFQDVRFKTIPELLDFIPDNQRIITEKLRELILEELPRCKEKLSFNVPFYFGNKHICLIWPGAVPWGKKTKEGVELGFAKGYLLPDDGYLLKGNRKYIYIKTFYSISEINEHKIRSLLQQALEIDEMLKYKRLS